MLTLIIYLFVSFCYCFTPKIVQPKRKMVMFDVASPAHSSPVDQEETHKPATSEQSDVGAAAPVPPMVQTSSMECIYDEPYETIAERRQSISKALIDQEHHKVWNTTGHFSFSIMGYPPGIP